MSLAPERFLGRVEEATPVLIRGWATDLHHPEMPPMIQLELDGLTVGFQASGPDPADDGSAGHPTGRHGFSFELAEPLDPDTRIDVRFSADGTPLDWPDPRAYQPAEISENRATPAEPLPRPSPLTRETMLTLALHDRQVAAAMAEWTMAPPAKGSADGLLLELMMRMATTPERR